VLTAFILGVEVECRIGNSVSPGYYARGWHITSTCGVFGAAAACAKLLGLAEDGIANAIGIAASQSAGIVENLSSAAKNVRRGKCRAQWLVLGAAIRRRLCRFRTPRSKGRLDGRGRWVTSRS